MVEVPAGVLGQTMLQVVVGATSLYSQDINGTIITPSTTELSGYINNKDKVLLVAGGGGGAENYFHIGQYPYPCDDGHCVTSLVVAEAVELLVEKEVQLGQ